MKLKFWNLRNWLLVLLLLLYCRSYGQNVASKIEQHDLRSIIDTLSSVQFEGRSVDNYGQIKTQSFIVDRYKALQLSPYSSDGYLEKFFLLQKDMGEVYLKTNKDIILQNFNRMVFTGNIPSIKEIQSELIFGGYGTEKELDQIDVENRFVLIYTKTQTGDYEIKLSLEKRKAKGIIYFFENDKTIISTKNFYIDYSLGKSYSIFEQPDTKTIDSLSDVISFIYFIMLPKEEVKTVMGLSKVKLIRLANKKKIGKAPVVDISVHFENVEKKIETANVLGVIKGESEQSIVISAHYDHMGTEGDYYFPGADDNASGIAAMLELAEEFAQYENLKYTMVFLAASAEEVGLLGSAYHVDHPDFKPEKVVCNINLDMIARVDKVTDYTFLYCLSNNKSFAVDSLVKAADQLFPDCTCDYSMNTANLFSRTDGYNFSRKGIPAILFFSGFHSDYHKPTDTVDKIDFKMLENRVLFICEIIKQLQKSL